MPLPPPLPGTVLPLLLVNYYNKSGAAAHAAKQSQPPPGDEATRLAAACSVHAFSPTTRSPAYLPLLLEQHAKLRLLVKRLLEASPLHLHVAFLYDLKRPGPPSTPDSAPSPDPADASNSATSSSDPSGSCAAALSSSSEAGSSSQVHSEFTDEAVELPSSCTHVILSGGNYKANDIDIARLFSRLPAGTKMFGICCGFQLLMRWHFGVLLDKMPAKEVGPRDVSHLFQQCGAGSWPGSRSEAQFSHQYRVPAPAVQARVQEAAGAAAACLTLVHDGTLVLGFQLAPAQGVQQHQGVQYHPECGDREWELVMHFLKS